MSGFKRFEELHAWQIGRELTRDVYALTRQESFARDFALRDQIRRACISITSNIAEGHERPTPRDTARFLHIAKASCAEVRSQLYVALDEQYLTDDQFERLTTLCRRIGAALAALIRHHTSLVSEPSAPYDPFADPPDDAPFHPFLPSTPSSF